MKNTHKAFSVVGAISVALFAYQALNGGFSQPSLFSFDSSGGMKKTLPSADAPSTRTAVNPPLPGRQYSNAGEDVNARISQAVETSNTLTASIAVSGPSAIPVGSAVVVSPKATVDTPYAATWSGKYAGPDAGTLSLELSEGGLVRGRGVSNLTGIHYTLTGKLQNNGQLEMAQTALGVSGEAGTVATFRGKLNRAGKGSGTWDMASFNANGTWQLEESPAAP